MKKIIKYLIPVIILVLIFNYLKISMAGISVGSIGLESSESASTNVIVGIAFMSLLYIFIYWNYAPISRYKGGFEPSLQFFLVYICLISYIISFVSPFQTRNLYFAIPLPLLLLFVVRKYISMMKSKSYFLIGIVFLIILTLYEYILNYNEIHIIGSATAAINSSYFLLYLLPFALCIENNKIRWLLISIIFVTVLSSFKRGATISISLGLLSYYYIKHIQLGDGSNKAKSLFTLLIISLVGFNYLMSSENSTIGHLFERFSNINEDKGSGRMESFSVTLNMIQNSDFISLFFGHGWNKVEMDSPVGISSHNDFLECLYDFGIIGLFLFLRLYYFIFKEYKKLRNTKSIYTAPVFASGVIFMTSSMFSHIIIYPYYMILFVMFWEYIIANQRINKI